MRMAINSRSKIIALTTTMLLGLAFLTACGGGALGSGSGSGGNGGGGSSEPPPAAPTIAVTPDSALLHAGDTQKFYATLSNITNQSVTWTVNGVVGGNASVGTIDGTGMYTAPAGIPSPNPLSIKATSVANTQLSSTASVTISNPAPEITAASPDTFQAPADFTITLIGRGFMPASTVTWAGNSIPVTYISPTQLRITGHQTAVVTTIPVAVTNPNPGGSRSPFFYIFTNPANTMSEAVAARFLQQSTWGANTQSIIDVRSVGYKQYLTFQFTTPMATYPAPDKDTDITDLEERFFSYGMARQDQLRQRMAFALSQIMVASANKVNNPQAFVLWQNMLQKDAFGNYFDLLKDVTLSPVMGNYLDMVNNDKPNPATGTSPNENYAREVLQLFSIGLEQLNPDGTVQLDGSGNPIPTYNQDTIEGFAHAFTGWTYPPKAGGSHFGNGENYTGPMVPFDDHHDMGPKTLLNGTVLPGGAGAAADMDAALQNIFNHPNVGPFIGKQLIQHFVTSNPSPEYVGRITAVFNNNGSGVRGDLKAVITAILMDPEARRGDDPAMVQASDGHLKEPVLFMMNVMKAMNAVGNGDGMRGYAVNMKQEPMVPPSVFNYYHPDYTIPGTNLLGPEFEIFNTSTTITRANFVNDAVFGIIGKNTTIDISGYLALAGNADQLVDRLGVVMMHGHMSADMRASVIAAISGISDNKRRVQSAMYLIASSSQFQVER